MDLEITFIVLFALAVLVALLVRWLKVPYTVGLVVAGLALGATHLLEVPHLTKSLLYSIFLPGLVFEAAFHLDARRFLENKLALHALAIPGVVVATVLTAAILVPTAQALDLAPGFSPIHALVFGALISATDPIAVVATFKTLGAPSRLTLLIEGESLLNDGTAAVLFGVLVGVAGGHSSTAGAILEFVKVVGLGTAIGVALGYGASRLLQLVEDPMIEISITTLVAWGSFLLAEHFGVSGILATLAAAMICGNLAARRSMSASTRVAVEGFWEYLAFALNSFVFLLIGFEVPLGRLVGSWKAILVAWLAVTLGRAVVVSAVRLALAPTRERFPASWLPMLVWGGQRGALSMVLALGLPEAFPYRQLIVTMTYGVVTLSIIAQGLPMKWLLRRLALVDGAASKGLLAVRRRLLLAEKKELLEARHQSDLDEEAFRELLADLDCRLLKLDDHR